MTSVLLRRRPKKWQGTVMHRRGGGGDDWIRAECFSLLAGCMGAARILCIDKLEV